MMEPILVLDAMSTKILHLDEKKRFVLMTADKVDGASILELSQPLTIAAVLIVFFNPPRIAKRKSEPPLLKYSGQRRRS